jgi:L-ascorbate metabolism protein UlaG (beta-lactamase superfamily)
MKKRSQLSAVFIGFTIALGLGLPCSAQSPSQFSRVQRNPNREVWLSLSGQTGAYYQLQVSTNLPAWEALSTLASGTATSLQYTDSAAPFLETRFYRAEQLTGSNIFIGDHLATTNGEVILQPRGHATLLLSWQGKTIYVDPTNSAAFTDVPKADLILVSHTHSDHFNTASINLDRATNGLIVAPQSVYTSLSTAQKPFARVLGYGASTNLLGVDILAVPAYNSNHPFGTGNAYVLTIGGRRIFISGDTGNTTEMRALTNIDVAFVCMNQPFTMTVTDATNAVTAFHPSIVYPYHYRDQSGASANAGVFKQQLRQDLGIETRLRKWY